MKDFSLVFLAIVAIIGLNCLTWGVAANDPPAETTIDTDFKVHGSATDDNAAEREAEAIKIDGLSTKEKQIINETGEKFVFQAEVNRLMGIIINSLYSNKEIFLRELISNSSDALDKIRFASVTDNSVLGEGDTAKLEIFIRADKENRQLHITDRGIGMTKDDLKNNLGTIARSGTKEWLQKVASGSESDTSLIGQFGMGFYSVFLVADRVWVTTKHNAEKQLVWESTAENEFTISEDPRGNTLGRGTRISLELKEEHEEFLEADTLKALVKRYSEFIQFPIYVWASKEVTEEVPVEEEEKEAKEEDEEKDEDDKLKVEEDEDADKKEEEEEKPKTKSVTKTVWDWERVNEVKPIWTRSSSDITEEEYLSFYKAFSKDFDDPLHYIHFVGEGEVDFKSILYIPKSAPEGTFDQKGAGRPIKLYVRRVFITDQFDDVMPRYLAFIKGVVDSDDLPLNVSREVFQKNKSLEVIKKKLVRKAIAMFQMMADAAEKELPEDASEDEKAAHKKAVDAWNTFVKEFGMAMKWGCIDDRLNRTRLSKLLRYQSSKSDGETTSFQKYVERMKEGQKEIYYLAGDSVSEISRSPLVEQLMRQDFEVMYMTDPIDEYAIGALEKYDGKYKFTNVGKDGVKLPEEDNQDVKDAEEEFKPLTEFLKKQLGSKVEKVILSTRLTKSPVALVAGQYGWTAHMEKIVKAQALGGSNKQSQFMAPRKIMEINHRHPLIKGMLERVGEDGDDALVTEQAELLFQTGQLNSGFELDDPHAFSDRIIRMMKMTLDIDPDSEAVVPEFQEKKEENADEGTAEGGDEENIEKEEL